MAGLGIGPEQFAQFRITDPEERAAAFEAEAAPVLVRVGQELLGGLARISRERLFLHPGKVSHRKEVAPEELWVAFCADEKSPRTTPCFALALTRAWLHARVMVRASADRDGAMRRALLREAANMARRGKPFRRLRSYTGWSYEDLPELAPAQSAAFWIEQAEALDVGASPGGNGAPGIDLGISWSAEETRSLSLGDLLGGFRDLAPIYKLLVRAK